MSAPNPTPAPAASIPVASSLLASPPPMAVYLGKKMSEICGHSISSKIGENQCAHFVSHVMGYESGFEFTCKNHTLADKQIAGKGAAIRVNEIFKACPEVGYWIKRPTGLSSLLIFVTISSNIGHDCIRLEMGTHRLKHVGIFIDGKVWHHGKTQVESDTESGFITKFNYRYIVAGNTVEFLYGRFLT